MFRLYTNRLCSGGEYSRKRSFLRYLIPSIVLTWKIELKLLGFVKGPGRYQIARNCKSPFESPPAGLESALRMKGH